MQHHLQPREIPERTAKIARKIFRKGNPFMTLRDKLGSIYEDKDFSELFSHAGRRGVAPGQLALVMVMQYMEGLTDEQAANAVRARIDWKYALGLELDDVGFDASVLTRFRERLVHGGRESLLLEKTLTVAAEQGLLETKAQRTDATHVLAAVAQLNRLELVGETLRQALEAVAVADEAWLVSWLGADWVDLYGERVNDYRLPRKEKERHAFALRVGQDGVYLRQRIAAERPELGELTAIQHLEEVWEQQYAWQENELVWRPNQDLPPPAERITSPFDLAARAARKRQMQWIGYKGHVTETCSPHTPHLITHVATTASNEADSDALVAIQQALARRGMLPKRHWVDSGYITVDRLVDSRQQFDIDLIGPLQANTSWQARRVDGFDWSHFAVDWQRQQVTCPAGKTSANWREKDERCGRKVIQVRFPDRLCQPCQLRNRCTKAKTRGRCLTFRPRLHQETLDRQRQRQQTSDFWQDYTRRAGVEGTVSQAVRCFNLRRARYRGPAKLHLQHHLVAAAMNVTRLIAWHKNEGRSQPRRPRLQRLPLAV